MRPIAAQCPAACFVSNPAGVFAWRQCTERAAFWLLSVCNRQHVQHLAGGCLSSMKAGSFCSFWRGGPRIYQHAL